MLAKRLGVATFGAAASIGASAGCMALGVAIGTAICPGIGTAVGLIVGAISGMVASHYVTKGAKASVEWIWPDTDKELQEL